MHTYIDLEIPKVTLERILSQGALVGIASSISCLAGLTVSLVCAGGSASPTACA